jgi:hypothetical protein
MEVCHDLKAVVELPDPTTSLVQETKETTATSKFLFHFSEFQVKYGSTWDGKYPNFSKEKPPLQDGEIVIRKPSDIATIIHTR